MPYTYVDINAIIPTVPTDWDALAGAAFLILVVALLIANIWRKI